MKMKTIRAKSNELDIAVEFLKNGQVVAIPTETVYGLAANALSSEAVGKIFIAKNRPSDNPLIVHISDKEMLQNIIEGGKIPSVYLPVIEKFWPGPLTLLFKKNSKIPDNVTCGQSTVGVRMPSHPLALEIIRRAGFPLAAPSANTSGRPSPTVVEHVLEDLEGLISCVVEGDSCDVGIESTVLDALQDPPVILRPGCITAEMLKPFFPNLKVYSKDFVDSKLEDAPTTPGMKYLHYSPNALVYLFERSANIEESMRDCLHKLIKEGKKVGFMWTLSDKYLLETFDAFSTNIYIGDTPSEVAQKLFGGLRGLDHEKVDVIFAVSIKEDNEGAAVMNRLRKAATITIE